MLCPNLVLLTWPHTELDTHLENLLYGRPSGCPFRTVIIIYSLVTKGEKPLQLSNPVRSVKKIRAKPDNSHPIDSPFSDAGDSNELTTISSRAPQKRPRFQRIRPRSRQLGARFEACAPYPKTTIHPKPTPHPKPNTTSTTCSVSGTSQKGPNTETKLQFVINSQQSYICWE
jgi:hypothetical protein